MKGVKVSEVLWPSRPGPTDKERPDEIVKGKLHG